jgi:hypothetical protein
MSEIGSPNPSASAVARVGRRDGRSAGSTIRQTNNERNGTNAPPGTDVTIVIALRWDRHLIPLDGATPDVDLTLE